MTDDVTTVAQKALTLLDLTSLNDGDSEADVTELCKRAVSDFGHTAAVCVWPQFVPHAKKLLSGSGVAVAAVANFPAGATDVGRAVEETAAIVADGGDEVDVVMPYNAWLAGDRALARELITACKAACGDSALLKVILETGRLETAENISAASLDAIEAGADFIKTSTGKVEISATLPAAEAMLNAIKETGGTTGFKAAGGIRSTSDAADYLALSDKILGTGWAAPGNFRFGASGLLNDLLAVLRGDASAPSKESY
ncbi:deoxyribose-phosphate aldolase [Pelagibius sp. Alg239-R121]|uniref:deoxyribose-phosphate aldolase n=1 Tax=Pelagibius sp. Alg239-R121 TaxID=2993448 RepID=UPI0024A690FF|nr:deoxyribose-phosphate aldolase [Pelagibius sp. Alg239-R121]